MAAMTSLVNKLNDSNDKDMAAMLVHITREANEKSFVVFIRRNLVVLDNISQHMVSDTR
jgi:hypothetical protein